MTASPGGSYGNTWYFDLHQLAKSVLASAHAVQQILHHVKKAEAHIAHEPFVAGMGQEIDAGFAHVQPNRADRLHDVGVNQRAADEPVRRSLSGCAGTGSNKRSLAPAFWTTTCLSSCSA